MRRRRRSFSTMAAISPVWNLLLVQNGWAGQIESPAAGQFLSREEEPTGARIECGGFLVPFLAGALWRKHGGVHEAPKLNAMASAIISVLPPNCRMLGSVWQGQRRMWMCSCYSLSTPWLTGGGACVFRR